MEAAAYTKPDRHRDRFLVMRRCAPTFEEETSLKVKGSVEFPEQQQISSLDGQNEATGDPDWAWQNE